MQNLRFSKKRYIHTLIPWVTQKNNEFLKIKHANNCFLYTEDNRKIIDFTSGLMVVNLGHNNKYIINGIKKHLKTGISYTNSKFTTNYRDELSDKLINITKFKNGKVFYTNAGADANETAIFIANEYHYNKGFINKNKILSFEKSFHGGSTLISSLLSGDPRSDSKRKFYSLPISPIMENPSLDDNGINSLNQIENLFRYNDDISSIIIEGSSGSAGCFLYPRNYLNLLYQLCKKYNILMICDEVMSGCGRTGHFYAYMNSSIKPDIITSAKGLTCGYTQLGAVIINEEISEMYNDKPFKNGLTYFAHPLSCVVANKCIDLYLENNEEIIKNAYLKGIFMNKLGQEIAENKFVNEYRSNGLLGCIELNIKNKKVLSKINNDLLEKNIFCFMRENYIFTAPPLTISLNLIEQTMEKINNVINDNYMHYRY